MILDDARSEFWIIRIISESALTIFLILCMELGVDKGSKLVESDFSKIIWISSYGAILDDARSEFWIIRIISESAQTIFLIFCMELGVNKGSKLVESDFLKIIWISSYGAILDDARSEFWIIRIISESALTIFLILGMELGVDKGSKSLESDFSKIIWISSYGAILDDARASFG